MRIYYLLLSALLLLGAGQIKGQTLYEGFEGTVPPPGWISFDNGVGTGQFWQTSTIAYAGAQSAYVRYENVASGLAEDWLVTPAIALGASDTILSFWQRQEYAIDYGSVYSVLVSTTSQSNPASFTPIFTQVETDFSTAWSQVSISLGAYANQTVYIAFLMVNDDGDNWHLDELMVDALPCDITGLNVSNVTPTSADINWLSSATVNEVEIVNGGATPTGSGVVTGASSYMVSNLTPITTYDVYARSLCGATGDTMIITGAYDGPLPSGLPKGVELYVIDSIPDLSRWGISSANNGGGTTAPNPEYTFPAVSLSPGTFIYVTQDSAGFRDFFGFNADFVVGTPMSINGDDAIELFNDSVVVDVFGDVNVDGTGTSWDYLDGWAYRKNGYGASVTFVDTTWTYSGINQLEGGVTNSACTAPFPIGTFVPAAVTPSTWVGPISFTTLCTPITQGDSAGTPIVIPTSAVTYTDSGNTACYTDMIANSSNDVWYLLVLDSCATSLDVSLCGSGYDTYLRFYDTGLTQLAGNDDACSVQSEILGFSVNGGDSLYIVVEGYSTNNGAYIMNLTQYLASPDASFSYPAAAYCPGDPNPVPTITGDTGGVWLAIPGLVYASGNGEIDLGASTPGTYPVSYTVGQPGCEDTQTFSVTIATADTAIIQYTASAYCQNASNPIPIVSGNTGTFSGSTGLSINASTGEIDLGNTAPGIYSVMFATNGSCPDSTTVSITVNVADSASVTYLSTSLCENDGPITPVVSGATGVFSSTSGISLDTTSGTVDPASSTPGTYVVTYTTSGSCPAMEMTTLIINALDDASFTYGAQYFCQDSTNESPTSVATPGGTFSSTTGLVINASTGEIDLTASALDSNHVIIYTTNGPCPTSDTISVGVVACLVAVDGGMDDARFSLYPIPNQGRFFLQNIGQAARTQIEVVDLTGRVLLRQEIDFLAGDKREIVLDDTAAGTYFLRARTEDRLETIRFQVVR